MSNYNTNNNRLQEVTVELDGQQPQHIWIDTETGEQIEVLHDPKFAWRMRKAQTLELADLYADAGMYRHADKAKACSTWLQYLENATGSEQQLHRFNGCKSRLCPLCAARRAKIMATRLIKVLAKVQTDHPDVQLLFLTLTCQSVPGAELRDAMDLLTKAWSKLTRRRSVERAVKGWYRAMEITHNRKADTYHPHLHVILAVEPAYFARANKLYITHDRWVEMWQQSLQVTYKPTVRIQRTKGKQGRLGGGAAAAAVEAAKYATKSADYIDPSLPRDKAVEVLRTYTDALNRKRLTAMGGWLLDASQELALDVEGDTDLVHGDDAAGELTVATAELLADYGWHWGIAEHVLRARYANPDYIGVVGGDNDADDSTAADTVVSATAEGGADPPDVTG